LALSRDLSRELSLGFGHEPHEVPKNIRLQASSNRAFASIIAARDPLQLIDLNRSMNAASTLLRSDALASAFA
jgi:hypothetical protein